MTTDDSDDVIELSLLWLKVRSSAKQILLLALVLACIGLLYTFVVPPRWEASAVLFIPDTSGTPISSQYMSALAGGGSVGGGVAGAAAALGIGQKADTLSILQGMLESRTSLNRIARQIGMDRQKVEDILQDKLDKDSGQIKISFQSKEKAKAIGAVAAAVETLDDMCKMAYSGRAQRMATELSSQLAQARKNLEKTEDEILAFQTKMQTSPAPSNTGDTMLLSPYAPKLQEAEAALLRTQKELSVARQIAHSIGTKALDIPIGGAGEGDPRNQIDQYRIRYIQLEYDLHVAEISLGPEAPKVVSLRREKAIARKQLESEIAKYVQSVDVGANYGVAMLQAKELIGKWDVRYISALMHTAPKELAKLQQLLREQSIRTAILVNLRSEYTKAQIDAAISKEDPLKFVTLDAPGLTDDEPVNKRWGRNSAIGMVLGLLLGCMLAIRRPSSSSPNQDTEPA